MTCKCGYEFSKQILADLRSKKETALESYAVVPDRSYRKFIKRETKVLAAKGDKARAKAIGKSARFVGTMLVCPECGRWAVSLPDRDEVTFLVRED